MAGPVQSIKRLVAFAAANNRLARRAMLGAYRILRSSDRLERLHPFDKRMGISAGGIIPPFLLVSGTPQDAHVTAYVGSAPDIVRRAISLIPDVPARAFLDLGCGRGRALVVASEFPFRSIEGIELNDDLFASAQANARIIASRYPERTPIRCLLGDASQPELAGPTAVLMYHPFGAELVAQLVRHLEPYADRGEDIIVIYINPVHGDVLDASNEFVRLYAAELPHAAEDIQNSPDPSDLVILWKTPACAVAPYPDRTRPIHVTANGWRAHLQ